MPAQPFSPNPQEPEGTASERQVELWCDWDWQRSPLEEAQDILRDDRGHLEGLLAEIESQAWPS